MYTKLIHATIRIRGHAILCAFVALSMLLIAQPASAQSFFADFEDDVGENDPALWVPDNTGQSWGTAAFPGSGTGLKNLNEGCGTSGNTPLPGVTDFADGVIQLDMSWEDDDSWGVIFRQTADDAGYIVVFGYIETPYVIIGDLANGCAPTGDCLSGTTCEGGGGEMIQVDHGLGTGLTENLSVSYTGRIEAKGDSIRVWFLPTADITDPLGDLGEPLVEIQDSAHTGPGSVGIWQESQGGCMIDNVIIFTPGGQPQARRPDPRDGAMFNNTWGTLSWAAGDWAVTHDVYMGDNFDDVNNGAADTFIGSQAETTLIVGFPGFPFPDGLVPGTTYYWRIDEVNDANSDSPWKGNIWSFWIPPTTAYVPVPADEAEFVTADASLSWTPGFNAKLHHVYFGETFDDVNDGAPGTYKGPSPRTDFSPGALEEGKTYYWRVDEFDALATHKGDVWSFTTVPEIAITDPDLMGWWKLDENMGTTAVDWSGHGRHGSLENEPQWVAGYDGGALEFDGSNHVDTGYTENLAEWTIACWAKSPAAPSGASPSGPLHREQNYQFNWNHGNEVFRGAAAMNVGGTWHAAKYAPLSANTWYHLAATYDGNVFNAYRDGVLITSNTAPSGPANAESNSAKLGRHAAASQFFTGTVDDARVYNRALTAEEIQEVMKGDTSVARHPSPAAGSTPSIGQAATLTWSKGDNAAEHDVYFGTDEAAVAGADASDTTGVYRGRQPGASYSTAADIEWGGGPYYWRIDEFNTDSTIGRGWVWSFSVADYLTVDEFESYNDIDPPDPASNRIFDNWIDGFGTTTNGALVGNDLPPYAETTIVHSGAQAMIYAYDNNLKTSEATLTLASQRDWTEEGVTKLSLWFRGDSANAAERMFVALNGTSVVYHDDPAATQTGGWTEWVIDLTAFTGVNLANVDSITIGFGTKNSPVAGGTGTMYFDDIRLIR